VSCLCSMHLIENETAMNCHERKLLSIELCRSDTCPRSFNGIFSVHSFVELTRVHVPLWFSRIADCSYNAETSNIFLSRLTHLFGRAKPFLMRYAPLWSYRKMTDSSTFAASSKQRGSNLVTDLDQSQQQPGHPSPTKTSTDSIQRTIVARKTLELKAPTCHA
jgi:hypothetical protein